MNKNLEKSRESNFIQAQAAKLLKQELKKEFNLKLKKQNNDSNTSSSSSEEDSDGDLLTPQVEQQINTLLHAIKTNDLDHLPTFDDNVNTEVKKKKKNQLVSKICLYLLHSMMLKMKKIHNHPHPPH